MAKNPSISFYTSDFITQTMFLTFEDKGKLIMLYCLQHQHGHLSKEQMESVCGNLSKDILSFFQLDAEGKYYNEQIEQSVIERENFVKSQKEKSNKRWNKKDDAKSMPKECRKDAAEYAAEHPTVNAAAIPFEDEDEYEKEIEYDKEIENKGIIKGKRRFQKPTPEEIKAFALQNSLRTDIIAEFCDYYDSNGWKVGRNPMKDWKATYRRWCRMQRNKSPSGNEFLDMLKQEDANIFPEEIIETKEVGQ